MKAVTTTKFAKYVLTETAGTLKMSGGDLGGQRDAHYLLYQPTVGALQAVDYKGPNRQYVDADKLIVEIWKYTE